MNMHLPQTEEARSEASLLMGVHHNLSTPRNGEPLVACSQDFLSAAYLITQKDQFFSREMFCSLVAYFGLAEEVRHLSENLDHIIIFHAHTNILFLHIVQKEIDVPMPAILKPVSLWTGKQVFTCILKPNKQASSIVNFEMKVSSSYSILYVLK